jgi:hypothetical protein
LELACADLRHFARIPPQFGEAKRIFFARHESGSWVTNRSGWLMMWPGLASLWTRGDARGLLLAIGFSTGLNVALVDTFIWPELFELGSPLLIWTALLAVWLAGFYWARRSQRAEVISPLATEDEGDALFIQAQTEYLSGHWDEAAWILQRMLARCPRDIEARLLLATLCRHQRRFDAAADQLRMLQKLDESQGWSREIAREADLIRKFAEYEQASSKGDGLLDEGVRTDAAPAEIDDENPLLSDAPRRAA